LKKLLVKGLIHPFTMERILPWKVFSLTVLWFSFAVRIWPTSIRKN